MNLEVAPRKRRWPLPPFARAPVLLAAGAHAALLLATSNGYGYHRDELYFRVLRPGWGYLDQPPLSPLLAHLTRAALVDSPWALRLPAVLATALSIVLVALITREVGGERGAQAFAAWAFAFASFPLVFGHVFLTNSIDSPVWLGVLLCIVRARLRDDDRWWLIGGVVVGLGFYNKLLVVVLLVAVATGILITGPRRLLVSRPVLAAIAVAVVVGLPNVIYQATHGWPQLTFGRQLSAQKSADTRAAMGPLLVLMLGPPLTAIWVAGLVAVWRRPQWRPIRFLVPALPVLVVLVFVLGTQPTYPFGLIAALFAIGCVPTLEWWPRGRARRPLVLALTVVNAVVSAAIALPLVPIAHLGYTPIPGINQAARDTVGWPAYVREVGAAYRSLPPADRRNAVLFASNYGEAGALDRYGPALHLPRVYSAHNQLYFQGRPPASAHVAVLVGGEVDHARTLFASCRTVGHLDNHLGVDNEEQGEPLAVCRDPAGGWSSIWPKLRHES